MIVDANLRQPLAALLKAASFDQSRPELQRSFDDADDIIHDPHQVVLERIGLEFVERLVPIGSV